MSARLAGKVAEGSCLKPLLRKGCWRFAPPLSIWFVCALLVLATPLNFEARRATGHGASASAVSTLPLVSAPEVPSHQLEPRWCGRRSIVAVGASFFFDYIYIASIHATPAVVMRLQDCLRLFAVLRLWLLLKLLVRLAATAMPCSLAYRCKWLNSPRNLSRQTHANEPGGAQCEPPGN